MALRTVTVNADAEHDILIAMVTSTSFLRQTVRGYDARYFTNLGQLISKWCIDYYQKFNEAPGKEIQAIYNVEKENIPPAIAENVAGFLDMLSKQHEAGPEFNLAHRVDQAIAFYDKRAHERLFTVGRDLIAAGRLDEAKEMLLKFAGVRKALSQWEDPFDQRIVELHFDDEEDRKHNASEYVVFEMPGALGQLMGPLEKSWLVAMMGPMKRGKTQWLREMAKQSAMHRKNTVVVSLEMGKREMRRRDYPRLTGRAYRAGKYRVPIMDCMKNQNGECKLKERLQFNDVECPGNYREGSDYRVCTWCRGNPQFHWQDNPFIAGVWYKTIVQEHDLTAEEVKQAAVNHAMHFGRHYRHISFPAYTATILDVENALDELFYTEGFVVEHLVLDYADILQPHDRRLQGRDIYDATWKRLKGLAAERNILVSTASQTNREAMKPGKSLIRQTDTPEDIRKLAHVDGIWGINQTDKEKDLYYQRINTLAHRHRKFNPLREVVVLQQLDLGLVHIDSEWW